MRVLLVGAGGVGGAIARTAAKWGSFEQLVIADNDPKRAKRAASFAEHFVGVGLDASNSAEVAECLGVHACDVLLNAVDPRFVLPLFHAAFEAGAHYLDMAMSLSHRHPTEPYTTPGVKLGDEQFAEFDAWVERGQLALVGMGVEPGLSDVFARFAADELFDQVGEVGVRDGANLVVAGYEFAPTFSIWTTIEECLNPPIIWERGRGWFTTEPFSEPELFQFPGGIGPLECVNVEHEEVLLVPRYLDVERVTFKYGLGEEFIAILKTLHLLGLDSTEPVMVRHQPVAPRDVVAACLPDPSTLGEAMSGVTCAGTCVTGTGTGGHARDVYLYHLVDNEQSMADYGSQAVVWQTGINPIVALELVQEGSWAGAGVLGPEAFPAGPFLERLASHGAPHGMDERTPRPADVGPDRLHRGAIGRS